MGGRGIPRRRPASKIEWSKEIRGADLTPTEGWVLTILHGYTDRDGRNAHPGWAALSRDTGLTVKTVKQAVRSLLAKGYLIQTAVGGGRGRANVYDLSLPVETGVAGAPVSDPETGVETAPVSASQGLWTACGQPVDDDEKGGHFATGKGVTSRPERGVAGTPPSSNASSSSSSRVRAREAPAPSRPPQRATNDDEATTRQEPGSAERDPWLAVDALDEGRQR